MAKKKMKLTKLTNKVDYDEVLLETEEDIVIENVEDVEEDKDEEEIILENVPPGRLANRAARGLAHKQRKARGRR